MTGERRGRGVVLVVDDEEYHRLLYQEELEDNGYDVLVAESGPRALEIVGSTKVDVVVLDIAMPGMDGVETLSRLLNINRQLPVILHTAYSDFRDDFTTWVAAAYVIKSSDLSPLIATIEEVLANKAVATLPPAPAAA
ncbi:MAG: response regulator [Armatimonadetes bacterium]|nr:response regulator [Armatimonadota bacterium]